MMLLMAAALVFIVVFIIRLPKEMEKHLDMEVPIQKKPEPKAPAIEGFLGWEHQAKIKEGTDG